MSFIAGDACPEKYYEKGRGVRIVYKSDINGYCECGYLTLLPQNSFEQLHGGLTVKRSDITIVNNDGSIVRRLHRSGNILHFCNCNACINNWR